MSDFFICSKEKSKEQQIYIFVELALNIYVKCNNYCYFLHSINYINGEILVRVNFASQGKLGS